MAPRFGNNMARMRLLLAQRAGYLPPGQLPANATAAWHRASKNLKRDARQSGQPNPMAYLRNMIQGGMQHPINNAPPPTPMPIPGGVDPGMMLRNNRVQRGVSWGGHRFSNISDLIGWEQRHGNRTDDAQFMEQHPALVAAFDALNSEQHPPRSKGMNALRVALLQRMHKQKPSWMDQPMNLY